MEGLKKFFEFDKHPTTTVGTEIRGGLITFMAMAYILIVNPQILSASGMPADAVFVATAIASGVATILMGVYAKLPFALAPGMGLNAYFAYSVCLGLGKSWSFALTCVLVEGVIFIILSLTGVREAIFKSIPKNLRHAVSIGIGLFIAFIGLINAKIVVPSAATTVAHYDFASNTGTFGSVGITVLLAILGILFTGILIYKNVPGNLLWGILATWIVGVILQLTGIYQPNPELGAYSLFPDFSSGLVGIGAIKSTLLQYDFSVLGSGDFWFAVFAFLFVDIFDTLGTLTGCAIQGQMLDENGNLPNMKKALLVDAVGTTLGSGLGTSTITTFVESSTGISAGARTGLAAVVTGVLFLLSPLLSPIFLAIPSFATAPALVLVGFFMLKGSAAEIDWNDAGEGIPAFLTLLFMVLAYSIATGIAWGFVSYVAINLGILILGGKKTKKISPVMIVLAILFVIKFAIFPV